MVLMLKSVTVTILWVFHGSWHSGWRNKSLAPRIGWSTSCFIKWVDHCRVENQPETKLEHARSMQDHYFFVLVDFRWLKKGQMDWIISSQLSQPLEATHYHQGCKSEADKTMGVQSQCSRQQSCFQLTSVCKLALQFWCIPIYLMYYTLTTSICLRLYRCHIQPWFLGQFFGGPFHILWPDKGLRHIICTCSTQLCTCIFWGNKFWPVASSWWEAAECK